MDQLERVLVKQRLSWSQQYFGGVEIARAAWPADAVIPTAIRTARKLKHAVVVVGDDDGTIRFIALPHPKDDL